MTKFSVSQFMSRLLSQETPPDDFEDIDPRQERFQVLHLGQQERLGVMSQEERCSAEKLGSLGEELLDELYSGRQGVLVVQQEGRAMFH